MGTVSRATGFSAALLRAWEDRYRLLAPARGPGGQRLYSDDDVALLQRVRHLIDEGRSIGEIAALGRRALIAATAPRCSDGSAGSGDAAQMGTALVQAMLRQARLELTLGWALDGGGEALAARSMHTAAQAAARLTARLDAARVLDVAVETLAEDFHAALARIWVFAPADRALYLRASAGLSRRTVTSSRARIDLASYRYKVGVVARTGEPFVSNQIVGDREFDERWVKRERLVAVAILPLTAGEQLQGILACFFRQAVSEEIVGALGTFAAMTASTIAANRGGRTRAFAGSSAS